MRTSLLVLLLSSISVPVFANGTARVDELWLKSMGDEESRGRDKAEQNPRNKAFSESFNKVDSKDNYIEFEEDVNEGPKYENDPYLNRGRNRDPRD